MAKARVADFVTKFLYSGDIAFLARFCDSVESGSFRAVARDLRGAPPVAPPAVAAPALGHAVTTCCPSQCCRDLSAFLARGPGGDTGCAVVAATRACIGGHADFVWNAMETGSGHDPYVGLLRRVYARVANDDLVRCAAMVCRGDVAVVRAPPGGSSTAPELEYLMIVPTLDPRKPARAARSAGAPADPGGAVKGVTVAGWRESERTVRVRLE